MSSTEKSRVSELVDACVHELVGPLMSIQANAQLLGDEVSGQLSAEQKAQVKSILRGVERLDRLLIRVRDLAELETESVRPGSKRVVFALAELLEEKLAGAKGAWVVSIPERDVAVCAGGDRLRRALGDLVQLAGSEAKHGVLSLVAAGGTAVVDLTLEGVAFPEELARLFEPLERLEGRALARSLGTGAALVGPAVRASGGSFACAFDAGIAGTALRATIELPIADTARLERAATRAAEGRASPSESLAT